MVSKIDINAERVLYWIDQQEESVPTRDVLDRFNHMKETRVRSKLDTLRKSGLVDTDQKKEYGGASRDTNFYETTNLVREYKDEFGLAVPVFVLRERLNDWEEYGDQHLKSYEQKYKDLKQENQALQSQIKMLQDQMEQRKRDIKYLADRLENVEDEVGVDLNGIDNSTVDDEQNE